MGIDGTWLGSRCPTATAAALLVPLFPAGFCVSGDSCPSPQQTPALLRGHGIPAGAEAEVKPVTIDQLPFS